MWVWNVTDVTNVSQQAYTSDGSSLQFGYDTEASFQQFIAFNNSPDFLTPTSFSQVENQNIHGIDNIDMAIIYHPDFEAAAAKLAEHRRSLDGFTVETIDIFEIYNEYAGGKADPVAVRDMARSFNERFDNFKYLSLIHI